MKVHTAREYGNRVGKGGGCLFCGTSLNYGDNGMEEWSCPKCRPVYKQDRRSKRLPPRILETGTPFYFDQWAVLRRAEADAAEAGWTAEQTRALVGEIVDIWVQARLSAQRSAQEQDARADAERAAMASRYSY